MKSQSNTATGMTYSELMKSNFFRFPGHNPIVHRIFNPFVTALIMFVAITAYVKIADGEWTFAIIVAFIASCFMSMKIALATMMIPSGHGVGMVKKGRLSVLGLPTPAVVMFGIILTIILAMNALAFSPGATLDMGRMKMFSVSMLFGFILSICSWRFHTYYETWYGSEYAARMEFKAKGYGDEIIEEKIAALRERGILEPLPLV